jgi:hypothetical protein
MTSAATNAAVADGFVTVYLPHRWGGSVFKASSDVGSVSLSELSGTTTP